MWTCIHQLKEVFEFVLKPSEAKWWWKEEELMRKGRVSPKERLRGPSGRRKTGHQALPRADGATLTVQHTLDVFVHQLWGNGGIPD